MNKLKSKTQNKLNQKHVQLKLNRVVGTLWTVQDNLYFAEPNNVLKLNKDWIIIFQMLFFIIIFFFSLISFSFLFISQKRVEQFTTISIFYH